MVLINYTYIFKVRGLVVISLLQKRWILNRQTLKMNSTISCVAVSAIINNIKLGYKPTIYRFNLKVINMYRYINRTIAFDAFYKMAEIYNKVDKYTKVAYTNRKIFFTGIHNNTMHIGRLICYRKVQNVLITLVNDKGDVLSRYTLGYFFSKWAKNLSYEKKRAYKVKELLHYRRQKRKYDKAKAKLLNNIKYKTIKRLVHTFCTKTIWKMKKNTNINMIDLIFINLDKNIKQFVEIFTRRFSLVGGKNKKINKKHFTLLQMRQLRHIINSIQVELNHVVNFICNKSINIKNNFNYITRIYSYIFNYYVVLKYIVKHKKQIKKFLKYHVFFKILSVKIQPTYLYH